MAAKEGEQAASFEGLLQLIGQVQGQEEETEPFGFINQLFQPSFLQQNAVPGPVLQQVEEGIENMSSVVQTQVEPNIDIVKHVSENPLFQSNLKNLVTSFGLKEEMQPEAAANFQEHVSGDLFKETGIVMQKVVPDEEFKQKELQDLVQPVKNSLADAFTMGNSTPTTQTINTSEKAVPAQIVNADQIDQEITRFLQSSINVTGLEDGIEAAFTLTPKHLGKVDVKVTIQDGQLTAEFLTSTPLGKELLESHVQALRSALELQGLQVGKIDIAQQTSSSLNFMGAFSQKGESNGRPGQQDSRKRSDAVQLQTQEDYRDYITDTGWVSQINATV